jgi:protein serine kinase H
MFVVSSTPYKLSPSCENISHDSITGKQQVGRKLPSSFEIREQFVRKYALGRILGRGASAEVYEARLIQDSTSPDVYPFAVKIIRRDNRMNDSTTMEVELEILRRVNHHNVIRLIEVYETQDSLYLVMERAQGGDLLTALANLPSYTESAVREVFRQLLEAVRYLHSLGIVHRDLKLDNLLFDNLSNCLKKQVASDETDDESIDEETSNSSTISVKVTDFGLSALLPEDIPASSRSTFGASSDKKDKRLTELWGTTEYFAPEVYNRRYGRQADVWALGCILFEMLTGEIAFPYRETPVGIIERILFHGGSKPIRVFERKAGWQKLSSEAKSLIKKMLKTSPTKRFSIAECLKHPWFTGYSGSPSLKHVSSADSVRTCSTCRSNTTADVNEDEMSKSDEVVLSDAQKILKERMNRRQRRYVNLLAEIASRSSSH